MRSSKRHAAANMQDALATMERSGSVFFLKTLPQTAIPALSRQMNATLTLPAQFVRENADKVEEWVTLRIQSSYGRSLRPWVVRLCIIVNSAVATSVRFAGGWKHFAAGNALKKGDSLIFLLKEGVRSEFEVHVFRGPGGSPYLPDVKKTYTLLDSDDDDVEEEEMYASNSEEEENYHVVNSNEEEKYVSNSEQDERFPEDSEDDDKQSPVRTRVRHRHARSRASTGYGYDGKAAAEQQTKHSENGKAFLGFCKQITISNIRRSDGFSLSTSSGQFEFPKNFVRIHGERLQASVQLQGVYKDSPVYVIPCSRCKHVDDDHVRISLKSREWSRFARANGLKVGQELQFSLTADSYFEVRVV